jgi:hypothetical protein
VYDNLKSLYKVEVDDTEVRLVNRHRDSEGEVFLQIDTEAAQGLQQTQDEWMDWVLSRYGDLVAEALAEWVREVLD